MAKRSSRITTGPVKGSKQPKPPATLAYRGNMANIYTRYGFLTTPQLRALADRQIAPSVCRATVQHQISALQWTIVDEQGQDIRGTTEGDYWYDLFGNASSSNGTRMGFPIFLDKLIEDIITAREGGNAEVVRNDDGVPVQILNIDAATLKPTNQADYPFIQKMPWGDESSPLEHDRILHAPWHPFVEVGQEMYSRTPVQMAYTAIAILAAGDEYNYSLLTDVVPLGILNLGPGFDLDRAKEWKTAWDADMQGANPSRIGLLYGTDHVSWTRLSTMLQDMAFESTSYWYTALVAACFEMSILDISILTRVSTRAAADSQWSQSRRQGLRKLMRLLKEAFEYYILSKGLYWQWEDIDIADDAARARIDRDRAITLATLVSMMILTPQQALQEAQTHKVVSVDLVWEMPMMMPDAGEEEGDTAPAGQGAKGANRAPKGPQAAAAGNKVVYKSDIKEVKNEATAEKGSGDRDNPAG